jgi:RND family efflux transporter MFP subunit
MKPLEPGAPRRGTGYRLSRGLKLLVLVPLARLRFLLILGAIALVITKWDLVLAYYDKMRPRSETAAPSGDVEYYCPMHPSIVRDNNKEKCPICFMPLSKRKKGEVTDEALPAGTVARVQLSPYRIVLAGVRTTPVEYHTLHKEITTVGTVEFNERQLRKVSARFKARIDRLFVNETGQTVRKGEPLASLYSPDLIVTVQNLLDARRVQDADSEKIARDRLRLWGIDPDQIDDILKAGKPITHLTIRSPIDGHVIKKYPLEGQYVDEGSPLFDIVDLSTVWVQAQLYEDDLASIPTASYDAKTGVARRPLPVEATSRARPGEPYHGLLTFFYPHLDPDSRTLAVRFELANPDHQLRPGMTTTVRLQIPGTELPGPSGGNPTRVEDGKVLAVPEASVIDTGQRQVVYRQSLPNTFDGVQVELGPRLEASNGAVYFLVLKGLEPGDVVVTAGSFLIDAETRLNPAAGSIYIGGSGGPTPSVRPSTPEDMDAKIVAALGKLNPVDRKLATAQKFCPVLESKLGSMGVPVKVMLDGQPVFVCCKHCVSQAEGQRDETLEKVEKFKHGHLPKK